MKVWKIKTQKLLLGNEEKHNQKYKQIIIPSDKLFSIFSLGQQDLRSEDPKYILDEITASQAVMYQVLTFY